MADSEHPLLKILEGLGEEAVRVKQLEHEWGGPGTSGYAFVSEWLRIKDADRSSRDTFETRTLARHANRIAFWAIVISSTLSFIAIIISLIALLGGR
jgi:hypothetical protein